MRKFEQETKILTDCISSVENLALDAKNNGFTSVNVAGVLRRTALARKKIADLYPAPKEEKESKFLPPTV